MLKRQRRGAAVAADLGGHHHVGGEVGAQAAVRRAARRCPAGRPRAGRRSSRTGSWRRGRGARRAAQTSRARAWRARPISSRCCARQMRRGCRRCGAGGSRLAMAGHGSRRSRNSLAQETTTHARALKAAGCSSWPGGRRRPGTGILAPGIAAAMRCITSGGAVRSCSPARHSVGTAMCGSAARRSKATQRLQRRAVGGLGHPRHQRLRGERTRSGAARRAPPSPAPAARARPAMPRPASSGASALGRNSRLPVAVRLAEGRRGAGQHQAVRPPAGRVPAAPAPPCRPCCGRRSTRARRPARRSGARTASAIAGQVVGRRSAPRRHSPASPPPRRGSRPPPAPRRCPTRIAPGLAAAADAVQQQHRGAGLRPQRRCASGAPATRRGHTSTPSLTTAWPSSATVQPRSGRSKWPSVWRPATSLAPVE